MKTFNFMQYRHSFISAIVVVIVFFFCYCLVGKDCCRRCFEVGITFNLTIIFILTKAIASLLKRRGHDV